ncbi:MAG: SDR family oxidoreductase [Rhodospirillales bacterium]|nr:SDR family oxidoreductase [Rhodospirillales bacterium]
MTRDVSEPLINLRLDGQCALITGASSGLGRHFAHLLARAGARVALAARRLDALDAVAADISAAGGEAIAVEMDVTDADSVRRGVLWAEKAFGPPRVLINNAGVALTKPALEVDEHDWDRVVDTNLKGAWLMARGAADRMREHGGGVIVNIASILGLRVAAGVAPYAIAKAGVIHMTRVLALELARHGIRVNALAPGYIETDLNRDFFASPAGQALVKRIPQRRLGALDDLDGPLLLLATSASRYMTGTVVVADGGHLVSSL